MKSSCKFVLCLCIVLLQHPFVFCFEPPVQDSDSEARRAINGEWVVETVVQNGKAWDNYSQATISIRKDESKAELVESNGRVSKIEFFENEDEKTKKIVSFTFAGFDDAVAAGGGGPRRGFCKFNSDKKFEMLVALWAGQQFKKEFSDESKKTMIHIVFSPKKEASK
jgi:hypothetical protein